MAFLSADGADSGRGGGRVRPAVAEQQDRDRDDQVIDPRQEGEVKARLPERTLLGILARTASWVEWWRRFGPTSGNEPKLTDPFGRYVVTTFVKGTNMGPYEAARHIPGVSGRERRWLRTGILRFRC
jgi:hypothetical protein